MEEKNITGIGATCVRWIEWLEVAIRFGWGEMSQNRREDMAHFIAESTLCKLLIRQMMEENFFDKTIYSHDPISSTTFRWSLMMAQMASMCEEIQHVKNVLETEHCMANYGEFITTLTLPLLKRVYSFREILRGVYVEFPSLFSTTQFDILRHFVDNQKSTVEAFLAQVDKTKDALTAHRLCLSPHLIELYSELLHISKITQLFHNGGLMNDGTLVLCKMDRELKYLLLLQTTTQRYLALWTEGKLNYLTMEKPLHDTSLAMRKWIKNLRKKLEQTYLMIAPLACKRNEQAPEKTKDFFDNIWGELQNFSSHLHDPLPSLATTEQQDESPDLSPEEYKNEQDEEEEGENFVPEELQE